MATLDYAHNCGETLAHAHALSDQVEELEDDIEGQIVKAIGYRKLFIKDMLRFAVEAAERVRQDHQLFQKDH